MWDNACLAGSTFLFSYTQCHVAFTGDQAWDEERGRKKIRKLALMKTRSHEHSRHELGKGEENWSLIQTSSLQCQMTRLWSVFPLLFLLGLSWLFFFFFLYRGRDWKSLWAWQIALDSINPSLVLVILQVGPIVSSNHYWPPSFCELDRIVRMNHFLTVCGPLSHFYFSQFVSVHCRRICRGLC